MEYILKSGLQYHRIFLKLILIICLWYDCKRCFSRRINCTYKITYSWSALQFLGKPLASILLYPRPFPFSQIPYFPLFSRYSSISWIRLFIGLLLPIGFSLKNPTFLTLGVSGIFCKMTRPHLIIPRLILNLKKKVFAALHLSFFLPPLTAP